MFSWGIERDLQHEMGYCANVVPNVFKVRGLFKTKSNLYDGAFSEKIVNGWSLFAEIVKVARVVNRIW